MSDYRADRRTPEERANILRGIERDSDGKPKRGQVARAARKAGVAPGTVYGWISRDGWPDDTPVEAAERLASNVVHLQASRTSGDAAPAKHGRDAESGPPTGLQVPPKLLQATPKQELVARWIAGGRSIAETARAASLHWDTVKSWSTRPGIVVDLIGSFRAVERAQIQAEAASVIRDSIRATADGYHLAQDIHREWLDVRQRIAELKGGAVPHSGEMSVEAYEDRLDALRGQYLSAIRALEPSRRTTLQAAGILEGGLSGALESGDDDDPLVAVDDLSEEALDALAESALRRLQGG